MVRIMDRQDQAWVKQGQVEVKQGKERVQQGLGNCEALRQGSGIRQVIGIG